MLLFSLIGWYRYPCCASVNRYQELMSQGFIICVYLLNRLRVRGDWLIAVWQNNCPELLIEHSGFFPMVSWLCPQMARRWFPTGHQVMPSLTQVCSTAERVRRVVAMLRDPHFALALFFFRSVKEHQDNEDGKARAVPTASFVFGVTVWVTEVCHDRRKDGTDACCDGNDGYSCANGHTKGSALLSICDSKSAQIKCKYFIQAIGHIFSKSVIFNQLRSRNCSQVLPSNRAPLMWSNIRHIPNYLKCLITRMWPVDDWNIAMFHVVKPEMNLALTINQ